MILDLSRMVADFERLSAEVPVPFLNGHLAVSVAACSASAVARLKHCIDTVDWQNAAPELPLDQVSLINSTGHAPASTTMVTKAADAEPVLLQEEPLPADVCSGPSQDLGSRLADRGNCPGWAAAFLSPDECDHGDIYRCGNATGRYARCRRCMSRWVWTAAEEKWHLRPFKGFSASLALPLPSLDNTVTATPSRTSSLQAAAKTRPTSARPSQSMISRTIRSQPSTQVLRQMSAEEEVNAWRLLTKDGGETTYDWGA